MSRKSKTSHAAHVAEPAVTCCRRAVASCFLMEGVQSPSTVRDLFVLRACQHGHHLPLLSTKQCVHESMPVVAEKSREWQSQRPASVSL